MLLNEDNNLVLGKLFLYCFQQVHVVILFLPDRITFRSEPNQASLSHLVREVKALNPQFLGEHIIGMPD